MRAGRIALSLLIFVAVSLIGLTDSASARWRIHNSNDVSDMTAPPGGTAQQTCSDQLRGATGWATFVADPSAPDPIPTNAFAGTTYDVWKAPPGFDSFTEAQAEFDDVGNIVGYSFTDPATGKLISATLVVNFTTVNRTQLVIPELMSTDGLYVFTAAPIDQSLPDVAPGDVLGLKPVGGASIITLTAIDCADPGEFTSSFLGAVDPPPTVNRGDAGTSYNVRFLLADGAGQTVSRKSSVAAVTFSPLACASLAGSVDDIETSTTGPSRLRFSTLNHLFVYRWQTPPTSGCYRLKFIYDSGQHSILNFKLR